MSTGGKNPVWLINDPARCRMVGELLKAGQYEQAVQILYQIRDANGSTDDAILAHVLNAACRICVACEQCRSEMAR